MSKLELIFKCKRCGYCCYGETTVSINSADQQRMIRVLKHSPQYVRETYWRVTGNCVQMKTIDGHCIFYQDGCLVHKGRPWRCAQWPLHPSILTDENNYHTICESCPGINKDISYEKFCEILKDLISHPDEVVVDDFI